MTVNAQALGRWVGGGDDELRRTGAMVLESLPCVDEHAPALSAVVLSEVLRRSPIKGAGGARPLTKVAALSLAVQMIRAGQVDPNKLAVENGAKIARIVVGVYDSVRRAAFAATRQLGGGDQLPLRPWMVAALEDSETPDDAVPESVIDAVALATAHTNPGLSWTGYAYDLGYVLYRRS